jgi:hypothetical protein
MTLSEAQIKKAENVFSALGRIDFNHKNRKDRQQNFLEPLELVATAIGIKRSFCAGLSSYDERFCGMLQTFAEKNELLSTRSPSVDVQLQLRALPGHKISHAFLTRFSNMLATEQDRKMRILWIYTDQKTGIDVQAAVLGNISVGELLGYPKCCTNGYLQLEAHLIDTEMKFYSKHYRAESDDDQISCYRAQRLIEGDFVDRLDAIKDEIRSRQALSIKLYPFIHFIACRECMKSPQSPASLQNIEMSELAEALNPTFARKFRAYADDYYNLFQKTQD